MPAKKKKSTPKKKGASTSKRPRPAKKAEAKNSSRTASARNTPRPKKEGPSKRKTRATTAKRKAAPRAAKRRPIKRPAVPKKQKMSPSKPTLNPEGLALAKQMAEAMLDKKATDVLVLDVTHRGQSVGYDYLVIATGNSDVQLDAIRRGIEEMTLKEGRKPSSVQSSPEWIAVDYDDVVAHLFTPETRQMYDLEGIWTDAPRVLVNAG